MQNNIDVAARAIVANSLSNNPLFNSVPSHTVAAIVCHSINAYEAEKAKNSREAADVDSLHNYHRLED